MKKNDYKKWLTMLQVGGISVIIFIILVLLFGKNEHVYIGVAGPITGNEKQNGIAMLKGIRIAVDQVNANGGINGRQIKLIIKDDQNKRERAEDIAKSFAQDKRISAVLGHYFSSTSITAGNIYKDQKIPAMTASATADLVTYNNPWYFRVVPTNSYMAQFIAYYINKGLKLNSASVIYTLDAYGINLAANFKKAAEKLQMTIPLMEGIDIEHEEVDIHLKKIYKTLRSLDDPGIIFVATHRNEGVKIVSALKYPGSKYTIFGPDSFSTKAFIDTLKLLPMEKARPGYYSNNIYAVSPFIMDIANEKAQNFRTYYLKKHSEEPSWVSATYYDAASLFIQALTHIDLKAQKSIEDQRQAIRDYLVNLYHFDHSMDGITGDIYFDRQNNFNRPLGIGIFQNQKLISNPSQYHIIHQPENLDNIMDLNLEGNIILLGSKYMKKNKVIYTGIDINEISNLNISEKTFCADFYLWFRYEDTFDFESIEFINADRPLSLKTIKKDVYLTSDIIHHISERQIDGYTVQAFRIKAIFQCDLDFHSYPFDEQILKIQFRHPLLTQEDLTFIPDTLSMRHFILENRLEQFKKIDYNEIPGWIITKESFYQDVIGNDSTLGDTHVSLARSVLQFSKFNSEIHIQRQLIGFLLKDVVAILVMVFILYVVYFIKPSQFELRLLMSMGVLMTNAFLHKNVGTSLQVGYILAIDFAFFSVYILSGLAIALSKISHNYFDHNKSDKAA